MNKPSKTVTIYQQPTGPVRVFTAQGDGCFTLAHTSLPAALACVAACDERVELVREAILVALRTGITTNQIRLAITQAFADAHHETLRKEAANV